YLFVAGLMGVALVMTASRGGIISLVAEIFFLMIVTAIWRKPSEHRRRTRHRFKHLLGRLGATGALLVGLFLGVLLLGGEFSITRFIDTVNTDDPTTGRAHFWAVTLDIIKAHPYIGTGLGAFGVIYTKYDTRNGLYRLEQAHNDYLQVLSDAGIIGAVLAGGFWVFFFLGEIGRAAPRRGFLRGG